MGQICFLRAALDLCSDSSKHSPLPILKDAGGVGRKPDNVTENWEYFQEHNWEQFRNNLERRIFFLVCYWNICFSRK